MSEPTYTPFEDCPHGWCPGCGTCHECERLFPPRLIAPERPSTLKGGPIPKREAPASDHA